MHNIRKIEEDIFWIGASNRIVNRFENMIPLTHGTSYNSYLILDEKTAIIDTVDASVSEVFLANVAHLLQGRELDYLVINHMEPDHCANICNIILRYPNVKLVGNLKTFKFLEQFYDGINAENYYIVKEKDELNLGKHTLRFYFAPLVHWPEVMMCYELNSKTLFSADAFGSFRALDGNLFADETDYHQLFLPEFRRYYANVMGKFGANVQAVFKKIADLEIKCIASLHGPIYRTPEMIEFVMEKYQGWSLYKPERTGVVIAYASMYGNTAQVVQILATKLAEKGIRNINIFDVSNTHFSDIIAKVFECSNLVIATPTYNSGLYLPMQTFIKDLSDLNIANRKISYISNVTWAGNPIKQIRDILTNNKNFEEVGNVFEIKSAMKLTQYDELEKFADDIKQSMIS